ncbi:Placental protein 25 (PP25) [Trypanosoma theileri]|uniref:Placental protein 25 (PP25) n=1 Tax=Trypanosoma theileri TaxID=67003 RepID=A0A1X0NHU5_9TRYP|nr:Placental protein 25 (PP25) [Trypanosoma theileri]ORC84305.1 Placental protein 25 (PP25) [Trypanosoma theileri]
MPPVRLDPIYVSFHNDDPRMTPASLVDGSNDTFVLTTGGFPQDIILTVGTTAAANLTRLRLTLHEAREIDVGRCSTALPTSFESVARRTLRRSTDGARQVEQLDLDPNGAGKGVRYIRVRLLSGYSQFVAMWGVEAEGEESQQRIAVLESRPEVVM